MWSATALVLSLGLSLLVPHHVTALPPSSSAKFAKRVSRRATSDTTTQIFNIETPGNGPLPEVKTWDDLCSGHPISYVPQGTSIRMILEPKPDADTLSPDMIYNTTVSGLADVVNNTIAGKGSLAFKTIEEEVGEFEKNYPPALLRFLLATDETEKDVANLQTVADALKGLQELTHFVSLRELFFGVFDLNDPGQVIIATGCFAYDCTHITSQGSPGYSLGNTIPTAKKTDTALSHGQSYVLGDLSQGINITISADSNSKEVKNTNYADVATQMLWEMIPMLVKAAGDTNLPFDGAYNRPGWHISDTIWRSQFSFNFWQPVDTESPYTLGRVAKTLAYVQQSFDKASLVESRMVVRVPIEGPGGPIWKISGIGCMSYTFSNSEICQLKSPALGATSGPPATI